MDDLIKTIKTSKYTLPSIIGISSAITGFACGYILGKARVLGEKYAEDQTYQAIQVTPEFPTEETPEPNDEDKTWDEEALSETLDPEEEGDGEDEPGEEEVFEEQEVTSSPMTTYNGLIEEEGYNQSVESKETTKAKKFIETVQRNIFEDVVPQEQPEWDYEVEDKYREANPDGPYPINVDEFVRNDLGYRQETLTYYAVDDILVDESDTPVYRYKRMTGELRFGYGSNESTAYYVRNAGLRMEWEILLHSGSYSEEVEGLEIEQEYEKADLKHSSNRRFRIEE